MSPNTKNTTLMIVILLFALFAVFFLDSVTESTDLFAMTHPIPRFPTPFFSRL